MRPYPAGPQSPETDYRLFRTSMRRIAAAIPTGRPVIISTLDNGLEAVYLYRNPMLRYDAVPSQANPLAEGQAHPSPKRLI